MPNTFKRLVRFWVPSGLLEAYRSARGLPPQRRFPWQDGYPRLPKIRLEEMFPGIGALALNLPLNAVAGADDMQLPVGELAVLGAICRYWRPQRVFEIGTYKGASTAAIALNTPANSEVFTLDLHPSVQGTHRHGLGIGLSPFEVGAIYRASTANSKIRQLFGDSSNFDYRPFWGSMNMVLVDADHTYEFVRRDTETAFALLATSGIIVWDDYLWSERHPECADVTRCLNELGRTKQVRQIDGTRLAIYSQGAPATPCTT
jgi:predicted O-methyltransferase YrrM